MKSCGLVFKIPHYSTVVIVLTESYKGLSNVQITLNLATSNGQKISVTASYCPAVHFYGIQEFIGVFIECP
jgi:hypothetical protein